MVLSLKLASFGSPERVGHGGYGGYTNRLTAHHAPMSGCPIRHGGLAVSNYQIPKSVYQHIHANTVKTPHRRPRPMSDLLKLTKTKLLKLVEEAGLTAEADATKADLVALLESVPAEEPATEVVAETPKKETKKATSGSEVDMELEEGEFVKAAYLALLKREADPMGLANYTGALAMGGMTKEELLEDLKASGEYKAL